LRFPQAIDGPHGRRRRLDLARKAAVGANFGGGQLEHHEFIVVGRRQFRKPLLVDTAAIRLRRRKSRGFAAARGGLLRACGGSTLG
jgi:hypothetical protein